MNAKVATPNYLPVMPEDLREIMDNDPRVAAIEIPPPGIVRERTLEPLEQPAVEEGFYRMTLVTDDPIGELSWQNPPKGVFLSLDVGRGVGLGKISERPLVFETGKPAARRPDVIPFNNWLAVSRRFLEVLAQHAPGTFESMDVTWRFRAGAEGDLAFVDVTRLIDAYDYRRSVINIRAANGKKSFGGLKYPRTLRSNVDPGVAMFRDSVARSEIIVSRGLAQALVDAGMRGFRFISLNTGTTVAMNYVEQGE